MLNNNQYKHCSSRGIVVTTFMTLKKRNKFHQEDPARHGECLNVGPQTLNLIGIGKQIISQLCVLTFRLDICYNV